MFEILYFSDLSLHLLVHFLIQTFQALSIAGIGKRGCALQVQRSGGMLPERAKEFLRDLFDKGEENSSEKVTLGIMVPFS